MKICVWLSIIQVHLFLIIGEWNFTAPGFTAIAHPAPVDIGTTHGVFLLDDSQSVWEKFQQGVLCAYSSIII